MHHLAVHSIAEAQAEPDIARPDPKRSCHVDDILEDHQWGSTGRNRLSGRPRHLFSGHQSGGPHPCPGHVPNREIATVNDFEDGDEQLIGHMVLVAGRIAREEGIAEGGYRLIFNCNRDGGQEVMHVHLHLMGGRRMGRMVVQE